ncbi:MAG: glycosyltransferase family 9 protein [Nevskia sp.]|nr:glycosyltransferase family 9 protein [Nevskia sp.]
MSKSASAARKARRILLFRLGSLGDTVVALPALHLLARLSPQAERRMLTNFSISDKAAPMAALLDGSGLVHGYFCYPPRGLRGSELLQLVRQIRAWKPDLLIYLHEPRGTAVALRDAAFFRACGIRHMIGVPYAQALKTPHYDPQRGLYEHKTDLLARRLAALGDCAAAQPGSWSLVLSPAETARAAAVLAPLAQCRGILAASIGAKADVKDWGDGNWSGLLGELGRQLPGWGLVLLGAPVEHARSEALLPHWPGPRLNLCGAVSLRESAAVLQRADVYAGHDSGPMHLAAAVGTPCVAIFSARNPPGVWFPYGGSHRVLYKQTECFGCELDVCTQYGKRCILSIQVREASEAVLGLARRRT